MTRVIFYRTSTGAYFAVDISGHAGYAQQGEDIVCAAISSAVMLTHALLHDVQRVPMDTLVEDDGAHIRFTLQQTAGQHGMQALHLHLNELKENYSEFINVMEVYQDAED